MRDTMFDEGCTKLVRLLGLAALMVAGLACANNPPGPPPCEGAERCECYPNQTCDDGLACVSQVCVSLGGGAGGTIGAAGGALSTGGSTVAATTVPKTPASQNCTDVASTSVNLPSAYSSTTVSVAGGNKQYAMQTNWWHYFKQQTVTVDGLSFSVGNPAGAVSPDNNPMGYPSFFIGQYSGHIPVGSNLPKQVSALTNVYTVLSTNASSKGYSNYNAAYDVWFTASSTPLPSTQYTPGAGGAYLMVWLFKPSDRQPRGADTHPGQKVGTLPGTWDVWIDSSSNPPCISYVSTTPLEKLDYDLNTFIRDAVTKGYGITNSMYLSVIFAGFEIWGGGDGLQLQAFCANVL
jgi:cellulose 1,4-beta-cellobiosidase